MVNIIPENEQAILLVDLPEYGLMAGDVGTIVHVYRDGLAYEMEFSRLDGTTFDVVTVETNQARPVTQRDMLHVRELQAN